MSKSTNKTTVADVISWLPSRVRLLVEKDSLRVVQSVTDLPVDLQVRGTALYHAVWHGSPHDHEGFDSSKIGSGENASDFGYGHYFTDSKEIAKYYTGNLGVNGSPVPSFFEINGKRTERGTPEQKAADLIHSIGLKKAKTFIKRMLKDARNNEENITASQSLAWFEKTNEVAQSITRQSEVKKAKGKLYKVELAPTQDEYLDWNKPLSEQSDKIKRGLNDLVKKYVRHATHVIDNNDTGETIHNRLVNFYRSIPEVELGTEYKAVSSDMLAAGIRGVRYKADKGSLTKNNYVVFSDEDIHITAKYSRDIVGAKGLYDEVNDHLYLIADGITKFNLIAVLRHELFHRAEAIDDRLKASVARFHKSLRESFNLAAHGKGSVIEINAYTSVMRAQTPLNEQLTEYKAYIVTEYNQKPAGLTGVLFKAARDFFAAIRASLLRAGMPLKHLTPADLNALASFGARSEKKTNNQSAANRKPGRINYCFAGQNAETADRELMAIAKKRLEENEVPEIVRQETGWFKGHDGQLRFEIDDSIAKMKPIPDDDRVSYKLEEILHHEQLFEAYPFLRDLRISKSKSGNYYAQDVQHLKIRDTLTQSANKDSYKDEEDAIYKLAEQLNDRGELDNEKEDELEEKLQEISARLKDEPILTYFDKSAVLHEIQHVIQIYEGFAPGGSFATDGINYHRLAGEVEARNTEARLDLTEEQRRATPISATQSIPDSEILVATNVDDEEISSRPAL